MPLFKYKGRAPHGEITKGVLEGADSSAVAEQLFHAGVTPIEIEPAASTSGGGGWDIMGYFKRGEKVGLLDIMVFSRQMHTLLKAGVPILRALAGMRQSSRKPIFAEVLGTLHSCLDKGQELSSAMMRYPKYFDQFYVSMVKVGEMTGRLDEIFFRLFEHLEFEKKMRGQIKSALRYPSFVLIAMAVAIGILNVFVIPTFARVYKGMKAELPAMTKMLIAASDFTVHYWWLLILLGGGAVYAFLAAIRTPNGGYRWDKIKLHLPIAGKIIFKGTMSRFARSFAMASKSGVPMVQAFTVVGQVVDNRYIAEKIEQMRNGVERGESVLRTATVTGVFSPLELQMIAIGEETGELDELMMEVAHMYETDVEYDVANLSAQIEPILLVFMAVLVLILALGIFLPMWDLGGAALHKG